MTSSFIKSNQIYEVLPLMNVRNLASGQLLRKVLLGDGLSPSACLRGYSCCVSGAGGALGRRPALSLGDSQLRVFAQGVLFVLLQHQSLSSHQEGGAGGGGGKPLGQLSLVAINPLSGRSILATRLHPPSTWSGR